MHVHVQGVITPASHVGFTPPRKRRGTQTLSPAFAQRASAGGVSLKCSQKNKLSPRANTRQLDIPPSKPCVINHHQGLFGVSYAALSACIFSPTDSSRLYNLKTRDGGGGTAKNRYKGLLKP